MTSDTQREPSDATIEAMLRRRGGGGTPPDLVSAISTAVDVTPQLPRQLRTRLARPGRGGIGPLLVAATIGLVALGAAIAGGTRFTAQDQRPTTEAALAAALPSGTPITPTASPSSAATPPAVVHDFGMEARVVPYLFSDDVGWVATGTSLYRTTDGGRTWSDRTPRHGGAVVAIFVVDADTAFVGWDDGHGVSIASTHDAGVAWMTSTLDAENSTLAPLVLFGTATNGTVTFFDTTDASPARVHAYRTSDGGQTWHGPTAGTFPARQVKPGGWGGGMIWLNVGQADGVPFDDRLWLSTDGGVTWNARRFPTAGFAPAGELKWVTGAPWIEADGRIVIAIGSVDAMGLFRSDDDGRTWALLKSDRSSAGFEPIRISTDEWVLVSGDGTSFMSTADAGGHWRTIAGDHAISFLSYPTFASRDHGWALHGCNRHQAISIDRGPDPYCDGNTLASVLLETTDGGKTWQRLESN
jgi:photosystem II stability/assembly factor-like uncharacterized protein